MTHDALVAWRQEYASGYEQHGPAFLPPVDGLPDEHWDVPDRIGCLGRVLGADPVARAIAVQAYPSATEAQARSVHDATYVSRPAKSGLAGVDPEEARIVGLRALGGVIGTIQDILDGRARRGYALIRPAGHHARYGEAHSGCVFNNVAVAAQIALDAGLERVLILDWDAHHGNGQQEIFWDDPAVMTISIHQDNRSDDGAAARVGGSSALGTNINVPLPPGSDSSAYRMTAERVVLPAIEGFQPEIIIVACGFDANCFDPAARLLLTASDFGWLTGVVCAAADKHSGGRLLMCHEGGYGRAYLPLCFTAVLHALIGSSHALADPFVAAWDGKSVTPSADAIAVVDQVARSVAEYL